MQEVTLTDGRTATRYDNGNTVLRQLKSNGDEASRMHYTPEEWRQVVDGLEVAPETTEEAPSEDAATTAPSTDGATEAAEGVVAPEAA